jgi:vacuolar-type H+-ATPase subunit H
VIHAVHCRATKKQNISAEPKDSAPKKRKSSILAPAEAKVQDIPEKTAGTSSSSSAGVIEILKIMTEPFLFAMLSPLGSDL